MKMKLTLLTQLVGAKRTEILESIFVMRERETGVIIITVINYGLTYIGISPYWQYIIKGLIIIIAVGLDTRKYLKKK